MGQDYDGAEVVDAQGERIGTVERSYVDDYGTIRFVEVAIGAFFPKHRLIPLAGDHFTAGTLAVPYTIDTIMRSPDASPASDTLEGELLEQVQAYYGLDGASDVDTAGSTEDDVRVVPGEVVIPEPATDTAQRVVEEEVVVVKRRVVKEVLRVRTGQGIEQQTIPEGVKVVQDGDVVVQDKEE